MYLLDFCVGWIGRRDVVVVWGVDVGCGRRLIKRACVDGQSED